MCVLTVPQTPLERTTADITVENTLYGELLKPQLFQYSRMSVFFGVPIFAHHNNPTAETTVGNDHQLKMVLLGKTKGVD